MQDFTGVPAVVDLAALRDTLSHHGENPEKINPQIPVDLVIDHSVSVDFYANNSSYEQNVDLEYQRNEERYRFLKWGQANLKNFRVVPPGTGIIHQINLEYLAKVAWVKEIDGKNWVFPDSLVGTDSHTTMINALSVVGFGVGGIEAEAAMLGQPITMKLPEVIGVKLIGQLKEGVTATDLVLTIVETLRKKDVVGKIVEFYGESASSLSIGDRAVLSNMAPEYGATCGIFPVDQKTIDFLSLTGRADHSIRLVEKYAKEQGFWYDENEEDPIFTDLIVFDLSKVESSLSGPKRPQDRVSLNNMSNNFSKVLNEAYRIEQDIDSIPVPNENFSLNHGDVVIAAITSCTNTSNPSLMIGAGLVAAKANAYGLKVKPWVKTSLAPGSKVVTRYLEHSNLQSSLDELGFNLVGYGCSTCIGNSGPLPKDISETINRNGLVACSVLSGNRNFEGRINPDVKANYLASPALVVVYALMGTVRKNPFTDPIGVAKDGKNIYLKDIWPTEDEIEKVINKSVSSQMFQKVYEDVFSGDKRWRSIEVSKSATYDWNDQSTYIRNPSIFFSVKKEVLKEFSIENCSVLALLGDSVTTDHISPAGVIADESEAASYLSSKGVAKNDFNSYGSRRGNHEVMSRGTFANIRLHNSMALDQEGGFTKHIPTDELVSIFEASKRYRMNQVPLIVFAGKQYGMGSSRDWAAKGPFLLGVKAIVAESYERIHRSNLIGMGIMPLCFSGDDSWQSLDLDGSEMIDLSGIGELRPNMKVKATIKRKDGTKLVVDLLSRIDTEDELKYFKYGGILLYVVTNRFLTDSAKE